MGYLFEINRKLAIIFIEASVKKNHYPNLVDYISELLVEGDDD